MELSRLIADDAALPEGAGAIQIAGLTADSRQVAQGFLFAAISGAKADGASYARAAVENGAVAVLAALDTTLDVSVPVLRAANPRQALAHAASRFYGRQPGTIAAITGTSGKTSTAVFLRQVWSALGLQAASVGTIGIVTPKGETYSGLTTPDPVGIARTMRDLADDGVSHVAIEASSHGLDQFRLDGLRLAAGAFLNLGRDHLDYHPTVEDYFHAKMRLFDELLGPGAGAVIDCDGDYGERAANIAAARGLALIRIGRNGREIRLLDSRAEGFGQVLTVDAMGYRRDIMLPLVGSFQASNALAAAGLAIATGTGAEQALAALETLKGAPGRLERAGEINGAMAFVDYAHKPEAVAQALLALRPFAAGRLIIVLGAGGDRDRGKRPLMGKAAIDNADIVIVTD
ncbi:MAG: UDP-N-acetylmuramoyl-L-alanyl-D-glutamate--2,6-diaminopimelate ligase, partial [Rhodobiaceae bacterium]|nr:UDP-N-acetylmuramoyl-L-alanyl-D-glutamate--2,6-diaminopimelate ligase [Rhodobiaceae bacterium]